MQKQIQKPLAIVGMGCRLPGADSLDNYWKMLIEGHYPLGELPVDRFDRDLYYNADKGVCGKSYTVMGGIVESKPFDQSRCPVPDDELAQTHPVHLNLCEVAADAIRHAGWNFDAISGSRTGVYVGHTPPGQLAGDVTYAKMVEHTTRFLNDVDGFSGLPADEKETIFEQIVQKIRSDYPADDPRLDVCLGAYRASAMISRTFGFDGPCMTFDAACASSLRALGHAVQALESGEIDSAIVGGASICNTDTLVLFSAAQSLTKTESCPFDSDADGLVASEAYVVLALKTLERAIADGDPIQAVIRGIGVSSDGKGKSLWAPRREGQIKAMQRAYTGGVDPKRLQFIEAHATSTQLGDATELGALKEVFSEHLPAGKRLPVGSAKANVGHTLESAGLTGLVKTVLAMKHQTIPPQIHVKSLNPQVDWETLPFYIPTEPVAWPLNADAIPRMAAVNAFGIGGLNVHVVLEEFLGVDSVQPLLAKSSLGKSASSARIGFSNGSVTAGSANGSVSESAAATDEPIAIVGMGAVLPGARTVEKLWDLFSSEESQLCDVPIDRWDREIGFDNTGRTPWTIPLQKGGFITDFEYDWKSHRVPPKQVQTADPLQFMLLDAADQAFQHAGYGEMNFDREQVGAVVGTMFGGEFSDQLQMGMHLPQFRRTLHEVLAGRGYSAEQIEPLAEAFQKSLLKRMPALIDETGSFTSSTLASRITKTFDLMGGATAVDAGDASSMAALSCSVDLLRAGDCDMMVCASGQRGISYARYELMNRQNRLAIDGSHGPFDRNASGFVPGDGVGVLLLKRLSDAKRDGDTVHGIIHGIGVSMADSLEESVTSAIERSLEKSGVSAEDVSFVESSAGGIPERDVAELNATRSVYDVAERKHPLLIGSPSGQVGHTVGGSGMVALLKATAELEHVELPANVQLQHPVAEAAGHAVDNEGGLTAVMQRTAVSVPRDDGRVFAGVTCTSQYNLAYHVVLERPVSVPQSRVSVEETSQEKSVQTVAVSSAVSPTVSAAAPLRWRIVRFVGNSVDELVSLASQAVSDAEKHFAAALDESSFPSVSPTSVSSSSVSPSRFRLAIVVETVEELSERLNLASQHLANLKAKSLLNEKGIFWHEVGDERPQIAFLFPGQGSQYSGMLRSLIEELPVVADAHREVDRTLAAAGLPSFSELAWDADCPAVNDVWRTQLSLIAADTLMYTAICSVGLRADRVAGHSFGELAALTAAGSWNFAEALLATCGRCASIESCPGENGVMLSTSAPEDVLQTLCNSIGGALYISHHNAPDQTVAGGEEAVIARLKTLVKEKGYLAKVLDVPAAFHTPMMEAVREPFAKALSDIPLFPPRIPLLSSVTNRYVSDPYDIRENLVSQMTMPIDYVSLTERLFAEGITVFVEVGPRQVLTGVSKRILDGQPVTFAACDHPKRNGLQQLLFAKAAVEVTGAMGDELQADLFGRRSGVVSGVVETAAAKTDAVKTDAVNASDDTIDAEISTGLLLQEGDLKILRLAGAAYEMGRQHGETESVEIRDVLRRYADLAGSAWDKVVDLETLISLPEMFFGADEMEELRGIAKGAGVTLSSVVAHNLRLYLDAGAGGLHFAVTAKTNSQNGLVHAVNEELRNGLSVYDCLQRHVQVRIPKNGISHIAFGVAGQVGTLNGINQRGLAVSTSVLIDDKTVVLTTEKRRLHTVLVKRILERATTIDEAVAILRRTQSVVRWSLCLSHHPTDRLCYVEFDGTELHIDSSLPKVIAANHRLMKTMADQIPLPLQQPSERRLQRLHELLGDRAVDHGIRDNTGAEDNTVSPSHAKQVLRDRHDLKTGEASETPTMNTLRRVDNQISIVMQPGAGKIWLTPGPMANGHQNEFYRLNIADLFDATGKPLVVKSPVVPPVVAPVSEVTDSSGTTDVSVASNNNVPRQSDSRLRTIDAEMFQSIAAQIQNETVQDGEKICHRFVMRLIDSPLGNVTDSRSPFGERCLILGRNDVAERLAKLIESRGGQAVILSAEDGPETVIANIDVAWSEGACTHLFLTTPFDADAETQLAEEHWTRSLQNGTLVPFLGCQRWYQLVHEAGLTDSAGVTAVTSMGGDFGLSGNVRAVQSGALSGLLKDLHLEVGQKSHELFRTRIVDFAGDAAAETVVSLLEQELSFVTTDVEVGYVAGQRYTVRAVFEAIETARSANASATGSPTKTGGVWVITGGARGITAVVAREIGRRFGGRLHLVGSTPLPEIPEQWHHLSDAELKELRATVIKEALANKQKPADAWSRYEKAIEVDATLRSFAAEGLSATYHACDVSHRESLKQVLDTIRQSDGPITGVVHGAGFERAGRFDKKKREFIERTFSPKLSGAAALMELTDDDPLRYFIAFSSVAGRFGAVGQADYAASNEMLGKLVDWFRVQRPECHSASFYWHLWGEVGMAVRPETKGYFESLDMNFLPPGEGAGHLIDEMLNGLTEPEIVVTDWKLYRFHGLNDVAGIPGLAPGTETKAEAETKAATKTETATAKTASTTTASVASNGALTIADFPMLDRVIELEPNQRLLAEADLKPEVDPFLVQHRYNGRPLMPLVATLEAMTQAATLLCGSTGGVVTGIRDIDIVNGLRFPTESTQTARVTAVRSGNEIHCEWTSDLCNRAGNLLLKDRPYLRCTVEVSSGVNTFSGSLPEARGVFNAIHYPQTTDILMYHGADLRTLHDVAIDGTESWGRLTAPDPHELAGQRQGSQWLASMSLLDGCFYASGVTLWHQEQGAVSVPARMERLLFGSRLPQPGEQCVVHVVNRGRQDNTACYDFTLFGADGAVLLQIIGHTIMIVSEGAPNVTG